MARTLTDVSDDADSYYALSMPVAPDWAQKAIFTCTIRAVQGGDGLMAAVSPSALRVVEGCRASDRSPRISNVIEAQADFGPPAGPLTAI